MSPLESIDVRLVFAPWDFASVHSREIEAYWSDRTAENRNLFNGSVLMLKQWMLEGRKFSGECFKTDFKSFLYWREHAAPDPHVYDFFGAGTIHSAEGWLLLARAGPTTSNAGMIYPPSGSIDIAETEGDAIDVDASIVREIMEETGMDLPRSQLVRAYLIAAPPQIVIIRPICLDVPAARLIRRISAHLKRKAPAEISELIVVRGHEDIDKDHMPHFVVHYIETVFGTR